MLQCTRISGRCRLGRSRLGNKTVCKEVYCASAQPDELKKIQDKEDRNCLRAVTVFFCPERGATMNESNSSVFTELDDDGLDIEAIFGTSNAGSENPFEAPEPAQEITEEKQKAPAEQQTTETPLPAPEKKLSRTRPRRTRRRASMTSCPSSTTKARRRPSRIPP